MIIGKASDISPRKLNVVNCLIQKTHYTQHEIVKKERKNFASIYVQNEKIFKLQV